MKPAENKKEKLVEKNKKAPLESKEKPVKKEKPAAVYNMSDSDDDMVWGSSASNFCLNFLCLNVYMFLKFLNLLFY